VRFRGVYTFLNIPDTFQVNESEMVFHGFSKKKIWIRPLVILADNDKGFRDYLEKRLSECFVVRSFDDGNQDGEGTGTFGKRKIFCDRGC